MVATMVGELAGATLVAGVEVPAHDRSAAMGNGPDGAPLCPVQGSGRSPEPMSGQEAAQHLDDGGGHLVGLARQVAAEFFHQAQAVLFAAMGEVEIHHGGTDLLVPQQSLHGV